MHDTDPATPVREAGRREARAHCGESKGTYLRERPDARLSFPITENCRTQATSGKIFLWLCGCIFHRAHRGTAWRCEAETENYGSYTAPLQGCYAYLTLEAAQNFKAKVKIPNSGLNYKIGVPDYFILFLDDMLLLIAITAQNFYFRTAKVYLASKSQPTLSSLLGTFLQPIFLSFICLTGLFKLTFESEFTPFYFAKTTPEEGTKWSIPFEL